MAVDWVDDLDGYVAGDEWGPTDEDPPPPEDADGANRLLRWLRLFEREAEQIETLAASELTRIKEWREDRLAGVTGQLERHARSLENWMRTHSDATGGRVLSVSLPNGRPYLRAVPSRVVVFDEERAAEAVEFERPEWVRTKRELEKKQILGATFPGPVCAEPPSGRPDDIAPDGYEWREAYEVVGVSASWLLLQFRFRRVPHLALLCPTRRSFGFTTSKKEAPR